MLWTVSISQLDIVSSQVAPTASGQDATTQEAPQTRDEEYYSNAAYPAVSAKAYLSCIDPDSVNNTRKNIEQAIHSDEVGLHSDSHFKSFRYI